MLSVIYNSTLLGSKPATPRYVIILCSSHDSLKLRSLSNDLRREQNESRASGRAGGRTGDMIGNDTTLKTLNKWLAD